MITFWKFVYNYIFYPLLYLVFHIAALFSSKVRKAVIMRHSIMSELKQSKKIYGRRTVWFHAASMGEFEHIKPVIERIKSSFPHSTIYVTFFSPSGFNNVKKHEGVDRFFYLPFDFPRTMKKFITAIQPDVFIIAKYDVWPNAVWQAKNLDIPVFVINASLGKKSKRHKGVSGALNKAVFKEITEIWVSAEEDAKRFEKVAKYTDIVHTGDTKFDQVLWRKQNSKRNKQIAEKVIKNKRVFIAGSIWPNDWNVVIPVLNRLLEKHSDLICILVPHEPTEEHLLEIEAKLEHKHLRYSRVASYVDERFIVVNRVGVLASLYAIADFAYVGGSFKQNVHNVMEPAVFGIPVFYGPVHKNSFEAVELSDVGGSIVIDNEGDFERMMLLMLHSEKDYKEYSETASHYVHINSGATTLVVDKLIQYLS